MRISMDKKDRAYDPKLPCEEIQILADGKEVLCVTADDQLNEILMFVHNHYSERLYNWPNGQKELAKVWVRDIEVEIKVPFKVVCSHANRCVSECKAKTPHRCEECRPCPVPNHAHVFCRRAK